jgi:hypothetical protein
MSLDYPVALQPALCHDQPHMRSLSSWPILRLPLALVLITAGACTAKPGGDSDDGLPHIRIQTPAPGATIPTCLDMVVEVDNFDIVPPADNPDNVDGQGHWHMQINEKPLLIPCEELQCRFSLDGFDDGPISVVAVLADNTYVVLNDESGAPIADSAEYILAGDGFLCD